jgi:protein-tyrosine phosphatase
VHVLVVCTANIARSPLGAAMLASSLAPADIEVSSAGVAARPGFPAAEPSQQLAELRGLDLSTHRSRPVTDELIRSSALVLTMSERHRDRCTPLAAGAASHVFTVRELVRLLATADLHDAEDHLTPADRLAWVIEQAHLARPRALPPRGREDVHDPIKDPWSAWVEMGATLDGALTAILSALEVQPGWQPPPPDPNTDSHGLSARGDRTAVRRAPRRRGGWLGRRVRPRADG